MGAQRQKQYGDEIWMKCKTEVNNIFKELPLTSSTMGPIPPKR